jgi:hypothetical protein
MTMYVNARRLQIVDREKNGMLQHGRVPSPLAKLRISMGALQSTNTGSHRLCQHGDKDVLSSLCRALVCACVDGRELGPETAAAVLCY